MHPGDADTGVQSRSPEQSDQRLRKAAMWITNTVVAQSAERGLSTLYVATAPDAEGGAYYGPGGFVNVRGSPERSASSDRSSDRETVLDCEIARASRPASRTIFPNPSRGDDHRATRRMPRSSRSVLLT